MPLNFKELRSCFLVWYPISVHGGCSYQRTDPEIEVVDKREESTWQTDKVVEDVDEFNAAQALRNSAKRKLRKLGASVGSTIIVVSLDKEKELDDLRKELRSKVDAFNATSAYSTIDFRCYKHRIEGENEDMLKDMLKDLRELLVDLRRAEQAADFKGIRAVVERLAGFETVLPPQAADYLQRAIADAKAQAASIRTSLEKKGETLAKVKKQISTSAVDFARFAVMEPGTALPDVDNELVQRMIAAQAEERGAGIELGDTDAHDRASADFAAMAQQSGLF